MVRTLRGRAKQNSFYVNPPERYIPLLSRLIGVYITCEALRLRQKGY